MVLLVVCWYGFGCFFFRYTKTADWDYIKSVVESQDEEMPRIPVIGE